MEKKETKNDAEKNNKQDNKNTKSQKKENLNLVNSDKKNYRAWKWNLQS